MGLAEDAPHGPSQKALPPDRVKAIVEATLQTTPRDATHWSVRSMAKAKGVGKSTVQRIWDAHGLQPHRIETFKLSKDKRFVEKLTDVVGVYLNPPDKAVVVCGDGKGQQECIHNPVCLRFNLDPPRPSVFPASGAISARAMRWPPRCGPARS